MANPASVRLVVRGLVVTDSNRLPVDLGVTVADTGVLAYRNTALSATKSQVKGSAGAILSLYISNPNLVPVWVKFYNAPAASVTVGTTTPVRARVVPPGDGSTPGFLEVTADAQLWAYFSAGITLAAVTALADASTAAPASALYAEVAYK